MKEKIYATIKPALSNPIIFNQEVCIKCNRCIEACQVDVFIPNSDKNKAPIVLFPGECWYCGCCVMECPEPGAITLNPLSMNKVEWKEKI